MNLYELDSTERAVAEGRPIPAMVREYFSALMESWRRKAGKAPAISFWHPDLTVVAEWQEILCAYPPEPLAYLGTGSFKPMFPFWHPDLTEYAFWGGMREHWRWVWANRPDAVYKHRMHLDAFEREQVAPKSAGATGKVFWHRELPETENARSSLGRTYQRIIIRQVSPGVRRTLRLPVESVC